MKYLGFANIQGRGQLALRMLFEELCILSCWMDSAGEVRGMNAHPRNERLRQEQRDWMKVDNFIRLWISLHTVAG